MKKTTTKKLTTFEAIKVYSRKPKNGKYGKTNLSKFRKKKGVYLIYENSKLVYIGSSIGEKTGIYKTIMRHFQEWNDSNLPSRINYRKKVQKNNYTVELSISDKYTDNDILDLEKVLIMQNEPRDNNQTNYSIHNRKFKSPEENIKKIAEDYNDSLEDAINYEEMKGNFNDKGELLDKDGNVLF